MRIPRRLPVRWRRLIAAILAAVATACGLTAVRAPGGVEILAAARDLPGGRLSPADVTTVRLPPDAVPDGAFRPGADLPGRVVAGPMRRGEPFTDARLLTRALPVAQGPGMVATPVRIADPAAAGLLSPGDVVDVLAAFEEAARPAVPVVRQVRVMTRPSAGEGDEGALLVLATTADQAAQLAQAQAQGRLSIAIHPR